jgi:hypothetical protein
MPLAEHVLGENFGKVLGLHLFDVCAGGEGLFGTWRGEGEGRLC